MRGVDDSGVAPLVAGLQHLLDSFDEIGLGYLSLDRPAGTLSGGEAQRTKMIRHLGSSLTDVTYVFDERVSAVRRVPSHSGQVVKVTTRSTKRRTCGCSASTSLESIDFCTFGTRPS